MSKRIPDGWFTKTVGDIGPFFNGLNGKTSKDFGQGEPFLTYLQVFNKTLSVREQAGLVSVDEGEKQEKVQYGDILFTTSSETPDEVGMAAVFLEKNWSPYLNSFCFGLRPKEEVPLSPEFANHFFRGSKFRDDMRPLAQGSTRFNLSKENLKKLSVTLPPLPEQKKIASILASVDEVIENTQKQIDKLQELKKATMNELLTKGIGHMEFKDSELGKIPKNWSVKPLEEACEKIGDGLHATPVYTEGTSYFFVNGNNLERGRIRIVPETKTVSENEYLNHFIELNDNTILMSINGTIGNLAFYNSESVILGKSACYMVFSEGFNKNFFYYLLASDRTQKYFRDELTGTTIKNLSLKTIRATSCVIPPYGEQIKISEILLSIEDHIEKRERQVSKTQSLKKSLMQDLLTGKVRVKVN